MSLAKKLLIDQLNLWIKDYSEKEILRRIDKLKNAIVRFKTRQLYFELKKREF